MYHVVIPVMDESVNIPPLVRELEKLPLPLHVTFVDDSRDFLTAEAIEKLQAHLRPDLKIEHLHRTGESRHGGLSGAVIDGLLQAKNAGARWIAVMDGDGQHDPRYLVALFEQTVDGYQVVSATRYAGNGSSEGLDGTWRQAVSTGSALLAKLLFPARLRTVSDPGSGMFAVSATHIATERLKAGGFKILLEILISHPHLSFSEVPVTFRPRQEGISKGTVARGIEFLQQLLRLRFARPSAQAYAIAPGLPTQ